MNIMKQTLLILIGLVFTNTLLAKKSQQLDTIYANRTMNTALFFPTEIRQGIVGSEDFVFTYNREKGQTLGLLKATNGKRSNLLVITIDGKVYSYIIEYSNALKELNRFISVSESIGHEKNNPSLHKDITESHSKNIGTLKIEVTKINKEFIRNSCAALLELPERKNIVTSKKGISLGIKNMVYHEDLVFIQFEIKNKSGIDFDINTLEVYSVSRNKKKKTSYQELELKPIHIYGMSDKVRYDNTARLVYVMKKFTMGDSEKLMIKLKEKNGNRTIKLKRHL